jgi:site-specific DNA-cytosine methylase
MQLKKLKMKILALCFFSNIFPDHSVEKWDLKDGKDVLTLPDNYGQGFDLILAAPPCDQFTKSNALNWVEYPDKFIAIAEKCFKICVLSGKNFVYENPPGRIELFIPDLKKYRVLNWRGYVTNKEYILYSNVLILHLTSIKRYGRKNICRSKIIRELWQPDLIETLKRVFSL